MMIRTISIDFDEISSGLPDVHHISIQNRTIIQNHIIIKNHIINKNHHQKPIFTFDPETFLGHLGGVGRLYLDDLD